MGAPVLLAIHMRFQYNRIEDDGFGIRDFSDFFNCVGFDREPKVDMKCCSNAWGTLTSRRTQYLEPPDDPSNEPDIFHILFSPAAEASSGGQYGSQDQLSSKATLVSDEEHSFPDGGTYTEPLGAQAEMGPTNPSLEVVSDEDNHPPALEIELAISEGSDTVMPDHYSFKPNADVFEQFSVIMQSQFRRNLFGGLRRGYNFAYDPKAVPHLGDDKSHDDYDFGVDCVGVHFVELYVSDQSHLWIEYYHPNEMFHMKL
ncbi:hypothetical protein AXG93_4010s1260 [Marchantia polymorpha subsp. ruderalis]|uniref:Uncharacterized protein n=1 Tax=Marchantia polymorpha subsp. ruderalis TaxID=1480154 RepID=A0A176VH59_MARPO|nr:hypothetical protein AXG93_4010s1260 [Marchantia polymorpha subsp. ruderalis]